MDRLLPTSACTSLTLEPGLPLPDRRAVQVEKREVALTSLHLQLGSNRPDVARPQRRLGAGVPGIVILIQVHTYIEP